MTHVVRSLFRDRVVLIGIGLIVAFGIGYLAFLQHSHSTQDRHDLVAVTTRAQIDRTHEITRIALLAPAADTTTALAAQLEGLERTHHGLRFGDNRLGLPGASSGAVDILFTEAQPSFVSVLGAARALGIDPEDAETRDDLVAAASEYRGRMVRIGNAFAAEATASRARSERILLAAVAIGFSLAVVVIMTVAQRRQQLTNRAAGRTGPGELDQLTGLLRRAALRDHLVDSVHRRRHADGFVALLLIGVTPVAGRPGRLPRRAFDRFVQEVARRIRATVRTTDVVARIAADQFAVVIDSTPRFDDAGRVAEKLIAAMAEPVHVGGEQVAARPGIGIALAPMDATTADDLIDRASMAQRTTDEGGEATYRYFSADLRPGNGSRTQLASSLRAALDESDELWLAYQPKIRLTDGSVVGFEALLRWHHPVLGELTPEEFIPIAEESDLIIEVGHWVINEVCRQLSSWNEAAYRPQPISINVSTRQFRHGDLDEIVAGALTEHGVEADLLEIEITEGVLMDEQDGPMAHMDDLRDLGVRIAVDDFGTGYSSLSYLKRLPIDTLKIDRSFVSELSEGSEDAAIATAIISLGHHLDLEVVAEGVETEAQLDILQRLGCDIAQGFHFAEPAPPAEIEAHRLVGAGDTVAQ